MTKVIIVTRRLTLTKLVAADAPQLFRYRSNPDVSRYQTWTPGSLDEVQQFIEALQPVDMDTPGKWFQLGIRCKVTRLLVGDAVIHFPTDSLKQAEIGITIAPEHQGKGLASEAVGGLLNHLFGPLRKHRVFASVDPRNHASVALLERAGMRQEAHFRQSLWLKGEWVDDLVFAILNSEWRKSSESNPGTHS